jgi:hypothetical protein
MLKVPTLLSTILLTRSIRPMSMLCKVIPRTAVAGTPSQPSMIDTTAILPSERVTPPGPPMAEESQIALSTLQRPSDLETGGSSREKSFATCYPRCFESQSTCRASRTLHVVDRRSFPAQARTRLGHTHLRNIELKDAYESRSLWWRHETSQPTTGLSLIRPSPTLYFLVR